MRLVVLESPYSGDIDRNTIYARRAVRDSLSKGESPIAGHLLYTQPEILRDENPEERAWGIGAHLAWIKVADSVVLYCDYAISSGMRQALDEVEQLLTSKNRSDLKVEYRFIGVNNEPD